MRDKDRALTDKMATCKSRELFGQMISLDIIPIKGIIHVAYMQDLRAHTHLHSEQFAVFDVVRCVFNLKLLVIL